LAAAFDTGFIESLTGFDACFAPPFKAGFAADLIVGLTFAGDFELALVLTCGFAFDLISGFATTLTDFLVATPTTALGFVLPEAMGRFRFAAPVDFLPEA
jgi:hypothetical protein